MHITNVNRLKKLIEIDDNLLTKLNQPDEPTNTIKAQKRVY